MRVWVVIEHHVEQDAILSVYASEDSARAAKQRNVGDMVWDRATIEPWEVQE